MFGSVYIRTELEKEKKRLISHSDSLVLEAKKILIEEQFTEKNILNNLKSYRKTFGLLDEEIPDKENIFTLTEIKSICVKYRLRFVNSDSYTGEFPYESILTIKDLNALQRKDLKYFKVLTMPENLKNPETGGDTLLFTETVYGHYYLIHRWGAPISAKRKLKYFPLRSIETVMLFMLLLSALITLLTPNRLLTTDIRADYFSMYRIAAFFHLLILGTGFMVFYLFKKNIPFSDSSWDSAKNF